MEQKFALVLIFALMITPTILASCAPESLYCDSSYQDILKCDEEGNQKFV